MNSKTIGSCMFLIIQCLKCIKKVFAPKSDSPEVCSLLGGSGGISCHSIVLLCFSSTPFLPFLLITVHGRTSQVFGLVYNFI